MQLSRRSRQKFADFAAGSGTVRRIEDVYAAQGFDLPANFKLPETGQRRAICAAAEAGADISDPAVAQRLLRVYLDAIDDWGRAQATWGSENAGTLSDDARALLRSLQQDGAPVDDEGALNFASTPSALPVARFDQYDEREASLTNLYKLVAEQLALTREAVPESAKGSRSSHRILQNLATAVQSLAELRNELGIGHGRTAPSPALARHARLAANAARTVVEFLLETWHERKASESSAALNVSS
jgi:Abortive infection C-terminus